MSAIALKLPNNYVDVDRDEMEYVDGGARYSGSQGWVAASVLTAVGAGVAKFGSGLLACIKPFILKMLAAGPLGWIGAGISALSAGMMMYMGGQFLAAGSSAAWYMKTKGWFNLNLTRNPFSLLSVS